MEYFTIALSSTFGFSLCAGIIHLILGYRRPIESIHISFSLLCFSVAGFILSHLFSYRVTSLETFILCVKSILGFGAIFNILLIWFISVYTGWKQKRLTIPLYIIFCLIFIVNIVSPTSIVYKTISEIQRNYRMFDS